MYDTISKGVSMVKLQAQIDTADTSRDRYIKDTLNASAGTIEGATEYRPFLVAALTMWTSKGEQTLVRADGDATFRQSSEKLNLQPVIEANLGQQQSLDVSQNIEVPAGWDVQTWLDRICGCEDKGEAVGAGIRYAFSATVV